MDGYFVGTESGKIHKLSLHSPGEHVVETYDQHRAPISGLSLNYTKPDILKSTQGLLLSSSFDWMITLWRPDKKQEPFA